MKIAIVNDLPIVVESLRRAISSVADYKLVWTAANGAEAVQKCAAERPDLILMDLLMPVMDGAEATRQIMARTPCPILVVTSSVDSNFDKVFSAMGYGAVDALNTPGPGEERQLMEKIANISRMGHHVEAKPVSSQTAKIHASHILPEMLIIGASTGGPHAITEVLTNIRHDSTKAIVVIQHVGKEFIAGFCDWVSEKSGYKAVPAAAGEPPQPGQVHVASSKDHLIVNATHVFQYSPDPVDYPYRPSVDVFFRSACKHWPKRGVAVLLTGMGRDGAVGLLDLKKAGWHTIAQDKATSVVYGMPKAAAELGAARLVLPLHAIAGEITHHWDRKSLQA
jgi:two-component system, chemotaxis family, response regulator WspF